jgi:SAM-dependent methyltransferase
MIAIARETDQDIDFEVADMLTAEFPPNQDIIFAFASILHLDKADLKVVLDKCFSSLNEGGVLYISTKHKPEYTAEWKEDKFGKRLFYFYSPQELIGLVDSNLQEVYRDTQRHGETDWFTQAFQKKTTNIHTGKNWGEL